MKIKNLLLELKNLIIPEYNSNTSGFFGGFFGDLYQKGKMGLFLLLHKMGFPNFDAPLWLFYQLYKMGWPRKYLEFPTKLAWRYRPVIKEYSSKGGQLTNVPAFSKAANELLNPDMIRVKGLNGTQNKLMDAYNKMRVGRYGCIVLQFNDVGKYDYNNFALPVGRPSDRRLLNFFSVTDQHIKPNLDPATNRVLSWELTLSNGQYTIHNERVIHLSKTDQLYHTPDFQFAWSDLLALVNLSVASAFSSASATQKTIISMKSLPTNNPKHALYPSANSNILSESEIEKQGREFAEGVSPVLFVAGDEVKAESIAPQPLDITKAQDAHLENLAAFIYVSTSSLKGQEIGRLAGDKDKVLLDELSIITREQITESLLAPFFNRLIELSILPTPRTVNGESIYNIEWVAPVQKSESESDCGSVDENNNNEELNNE